jgi:hypothetical protein
MCAFKFYYINCESECFAALSWVRKCLAVIAVSSCWVSILPVLIV